MKPQQAYNIWAQQYDSNENKTRDLEAVAIRKILKEFSFSNCLEIGCGTGKNTEWLVQKATVTAVDFSEEMLAKAKEKIQSSNAHFVHADITEPWTFTNEKYELVTFSLVLEHIKNLDFIFKQAVKVLLPGSHIYIGELHPYKQYTGSKARFETSGGTQVVECYIHHVSDFMQAAKSNGFVISDINEFFDDNDFNSPPRILALLFKNS